MLIEKVETLGFNAKKLAHIDGFLKEKYLDNGLLPNAQLLISRHGKIAHFSSQGDACQYKDHEIDERSIFRIASMTKPITSIAFMQLVEAGKVALDTPLSEVLPEFKTTQVYVTGGGSVPFQTKPLSREILLLDLLRHTSGISYGFQNRSNIDAAYRKHQIDIDRVESWYTGQTLDQWIAEIAKMPLEFSPGEAWNYSLSTDILGAVIQRISGLSLGAYLQKNIFAPLGMKDTGFVVPEIEADRLTDCYIWAGPEKGRVLFDQAQKSLWFKQPSLHSGGGGLVSTALDYHRFCQMCQNGGHIDDVHIIGRKTLELMTTNHLPDGSDLSSMSISMFSETQNAGTGFGLGFAITQDIAKAMIPGSAGEYYWGGMFSTSFFIDPVEDLHVIFMTQLGPSSLYPIRRDLKTLIYSALI